MSGDRYDLITMANMALRGDLDGLWKAIWRLSDVANDPLVQGVQDIAARDGWTRERLATVLAAVLLDAHIDYRERIRELANMQPPAPIIIPREALPPSKPEAVPMEPVRFKIAEPLPGDRGPGC